MRDDDSGDESGTSASDESVDESTDSGTSSPAGEANVASSVPPNGQQTLSDNGTLLRYLSDGTQQPFVPAPATARHPDQPASIPPSGNGTDDAVEEQGSESPSEDSDDVDEVFRPLDPGAPLKPLAPRTRVASTVPEDVNSDDWRAQPPVVPPRRDPSPPDEPQGDVNFKDFVNDLVD